MNGLAFEHYIDKPWLIFMLWHTETIQATLKAGVDDAISARRPIDDLTVARLRWYPSLVGELILNGKIARPDIERILDNPVTRFYAMAGHYEELAPTLESGLMSSPEGVERMIRWLRYKNITPLRNEQEYFDNLGDDPNRHYRLTPPNARVSSEDLRAEAAKNKHLSAAWAYLWVSSSQNPVLTDEIISVLKTDEEYAYLAAYVLRRRNFPTERWIDLITEIKSPRWAFHVVRDIEPGSSIPVHIRSRLLRCVHVSPPWAVQLWESRGWRGDHLKIAAHECGILSAGHECDIELNAWLRLARMVAGTRIAVSAA